MTTLRIATFLLLILGTATTLSAQAQRTEKINGYTFTLIHETGRNAIQNQARSNTCWSFATLSFLESELIRQGKEAPDFSEMFMVRNSYALKAEKYVRMHGNLNFAGGGAFHDVLEVVGKAGLVPEEAYPGKLVDSNNHIHMEMDAVLKAVADAVVANPNKKLSSQWGNAIEGVLDAYLGDYPSTFTYQGKEYTPLSFAESLGIQTGDYIELSSFTHHPLHSQFVLEVPDNWSCGLVYNLGLDEMMDVIDNALENGYSVAWGGDISEKGFSFREGLALVPEAGRNGDSEDSPFEVPCQEMEITAQLRQEAFDDYRTQDDHAMHITGLAKDQNGDKFYLIKNSWGEGNSCGGYLYASEAYVRYKTTAIMLHKAALPKALAKDLNIR